MVQDLLAEVEAARAAEKAHEQHSERVKELLVQLRIERPDMKLAQIEELIGRFYERASISRFTSHALPDKRSRKRRTVTA